MNVIAHDAQSMELEFKLLQSFLERIEKHLSAFPASQAKLAVIAASRDVVAVSGLNGSGLARHQLLVLNLAVRNRFAVEAAAIQVNCFTNRGIV